jgi:hypothetical protein
VAAVDQDDDGAVVETVGERDVAAGGAREGERRGRVAVE